MRIIQERVGDVNVVQIEGNEFEIGALWSSADHVDKGGNVGVAMTGQCPDNHVLVIVVKVIPPVPPEK